MLGNSSNNIKTQQQNEQINNEIVNISDAETVGCASDIADAEAIQYVELYRDRRLINNQYRLKAKRRP